jgi:hypothetical protein
VAAVGDSAAEVEEIALKKNPNKLPPGHFDPSQGRSRMPPPLIFRYKVYKGLESPIIPIGLKSAIGWRKVWGYIDSGSIYSILQEGEAQRLKIAIEEGQKKDDQGREWRDLFRSISIPWRFRSVISDFKP